MNHGEHLIYTMEYQDNYSKVVIGFKLVRAGGLLWRRHTVVLDDAALFAGRGPQALDYLRRKFMEMTGRELPCDGWMRFREFMKTLESKGVGS